MKETYILKHKDNVTAALLIDIETGELSNMQVLSEEDMPVLGAHDIGHFSEWFNSRAIPEGRDQLEQILATAGCSTPQEYLVKNLALSLDDTYWICPSAIPSLSWDQVNLFSNGGKVLSFHDGAGRAYYTSPNGSLNGSLDKEAVYRNGHWFLKKTDGSGSGEGLRNINEAFAALIHKQQGFREYVNYTLNFNKYGNAESCECRYFTDDKHELLSAYDVTGGRTEHYDAVKTLNHFIQVCTENGLKRSYVQDFLDYQFMTDFVISNTDRHWKNFGILRNPESLRFLSMAPIFDSGTSMVFNEPFIRNRLSLLRMETHGVERLPQDQLRLVRNPDLVKIDDLPTEKETREFYVSNGVTPERAAQISHCYAMKVDMLCEFQHHIAVSIEQEMTYNGEYPYINRVANPDSRH